MEGSSLWIGITIDSIAMRHTSVASGPCGAMLYFVAPMDRVPFQATAGGALYEGIGTLPASILLDNVRSMYNVGAFFRTADAAGIEKLYLCGITSHPPKKAISKTALGAEERASWEHAWDPLPLVAALRARNYE